MKLLLYLINKNECVYVAYKFKRIQQFQPNVLHFTYDPGTNTMMVNTPKGRGDKGVEF